MLDGYSMATSVWNVYNFLASSVSEIAGSFANIQWTIIIDNRVHLIHSDY